MLQFVIATLLLTVHLQFAFAQGDGRPPNGGGQNITVQGVYIDPKGTLRYSSSKHVAEKFKRDRKLGKSFVSISLPRLFAAAQALHKAGKPIPARMKYLDGLVKLQYVVIDAKSKDLIIAGRCEPIDAGNPFRPRGKKTGRPVLQMEDLIVALRTVGPGRKASAFGCTLVHDPKAVERVAALQRRVKTIRGGSPRKVQLALKQAIGPLQAKFFGVPASSRYAFVCIEADYRMKRISLGIERPPVRGLRSYISQTSGGNLFNRFWFVADYPPLSVATTMTSRDSKRGDPLQVAPIRPDSTIIGIPPHGLKLRASNSPTQVTQTNSAAVKFAESFSKKLPELEAAVPGFADLQNLAELALLAVLIDRDRVHAAIGWDIAWLLKADGFRVAKFATPKQAETLVAFKSRGRRTVTVAGGVQLSVRRFAARRKKSAMKSAPEISREISKGSWSRRVSSK